MIKNKNQKYVQAIWFICLGAIIGMLFMSIPLYETQKEKEFYKNLVFFEINLTKHCLDLTGITHDQLLESFIRKEVDIIFNATSNKMGSKLKGISCYNGEYEVDCLNYSKVLDNRSLSEINEESIA